MRRPQSLHSHERLRASEIMKLRIMKHHTPYTYTGSTPCTIHSSTPKIMKLRIMKHHTPYTYTGSTPCTIHSSTPKIMKLWIMKHHTPYTHTGSTPCTIHSSTPKIMKLRASEIMERAAVRADTGRRGDLYTAMSGSRGTSKIMRDSLGGGCIAEHLALFGRIKLLAGVGDHGESGCQSRHERLEEAISTQP
jgi:hypothetical protein